MVLKVVTPSSVEVLIVAVSLVALILSHHRSPSSQIRLIRATALMALIACVTAVGLRILGDWLN